MLVHIGCPFEKEKHFIVAFKPREMVDKQHNHRHAMCAKSYNYIVYFLYNVVLCMYTYILLHVFNMMVDYPVTEFILNS